jgi:hypothetical protein
VIKNIEELFPESELTALAMLLGNFEHNALKDTETIDYVARIYAFNQDTRT